MLARSLLVAGLLQTRTLASARTYRPLKTTFPCSVSSVRAQRTYRPAARINPEVHSMGSLEPLPPAPVLQRDLFNECLQLKALRIPKKECQKYMKLLAGCGTRELYSRCALLSVEGVAAFHCRSSCRHTFEKPRLRCIIPDAAGEDTRLLLLAETVHERGMFSASTTS